MIDKLKMIGYFLISVGIIVFLVHSYNPTSTSGGMLLSPISDYTPKVPDKKINLNSIHAGSFKNFPMVAPKAGLQQIFNNLKAHANITAPLLLRIEMTPIPNAFMQSTGILVVTSGELTECHRGTDCLAATIGHELGHWKLGHVQGHTYAPKQMEKDADLFGTALATKSGYECRAGADYFTQRIEKYGDDDGGTDHPRDSDRVTYMNDLCDKLGK